MQNHGPSPNHHQPQSGDSFRDLQPFSDNKASQPWSRNQVPLPVRKISNMVVVFGGIAVVGFVMGVVVANFLAS